MSVILTGMGFPAGCEECRFRQGELNSLQIPYCKLFYAGGYVLKDDFENRRGDCPLKSVDGLIAEIYDEFMKVDCGLHYKTVKKCIEIIREYFGEGKISRKEKE